jgi:dihydroorotate dehydrogenase (fumarate)
MIDLSTTYLGLRLAHPLVASASPLSYTLDGIRSLEDGGAAAIVMHSLFEEQIEEQAELLDHYLSYGAESFAEALGYFPEPKDYNLGPEEYLELIAAAKRAVDVPVIASLNGASPGGWTRYAKLMEDAGADALELNIYLLPTDLDVGSADIEQRMLDVLRDVRELVSIPLAVKLSPYLSAPANVAVRFGRAGADALVLFNRFYQPDLDLEELEVVPRVALSDSDDLRLPLRWIAILYGRLEAELALTGGVHSHIDALKGLMAGAQVAMATSALLKRGAGHMGVMRDAMRAWLDEREYASIEQLRGSMSQRHVANRDAFERANYMRTLQSWRPDPMGRDAGVPRRA